MNLRLTESCTKVQTSRSRYGDFNIKELGTINCLFRNVSLLNPSSNHREDATIQGIFWFEASSGIGKGDMVKYQGDYYRMENITVAKNLLTLNTVQFIKCSASLIRQVS